VGRCQVCQSQKQAFFFNQNQNAPPGYHPAGRLPFGGRKTETFQVETAPLREAAQSPREPWQKALDRFSDCSCVFAAIFPHGLSSAVSCHGRHDARHKGEICPPSR
ncbi:hypothetical protein, partial [Jiella mangrovi]